MTPCAPLAGRAPRTAHCSLLAAHGSPLARSLAHCSPLTAHHPAPLTALHAARPHASRHAAHVSMSVPPGRIDAEALSLSRTGHLRRLRFRLPLKRHRAARSLRFCHTRADGTFFALVRSGALEHGGSIVTRSYPAIMLRITPSDHHAFAARFPSFLSPFHQAFGC